MTNDIYKTPDAELNQAQPEPVASTYYVVSAKKFITLSILTFGFYVVYWFDRQWRTIKVRDGSNIWPIPRAIFSIFYVHALYRIIDESLKEKDKTFNWSPDKTAWAYIASACANVILNQLVPSSQESIIVFLVLPFFIWFTLKAQMAINIVCGDPDGQSNNRFSTTNIVLILLCGIFWLMFLLGAYMQLTGKV